MHHKKRVRSLTWKPHKLYSRNFIQISISMRRCAECKNGNSAFYTFWVIFLWTLCVTKIVSALELKNHFSYIHETLYKYQSAWDDVQSARMELCLLYFLSYFPWNFVHHKNRVRSITWKPLKLYSWNFIQVSTNLSWGAECKKSNSVIYTLWVISLGTLSITKTIIYDYFIPGYDCVIVNYIDRYLY